MCHPATRITLSQLCTATGVSPSRVEFLHRIGYLSVPLSDDVGRRAYTIENILEVSLAEELTKAFFNRHQLLQLAATLRAAIAELSPSARIVARYRHYIETVMRLADVFGRGDGYDAWLKLQTQQLRRMERTLARTEESAETGLDARLGALFTATKPTGVKSAALAG